MEICPPQVGWQHARAHKLLPSDTITHLQSASEFESLSDVVIGLFLNALDANAGDVTVVLDSSRGFCSLQDDGHGIAVRELEKDTSFPGSVHSRARNFLAALAAIATVTIISSTSDRRFENRFVVERSGMRKTHIPPSSHDSLCLGQAVSGTKVIVENIFAHLPVRAKRCVRHDELTDQNACDEVRTKIIALLLAWHRPIRVTLSDQRRPFTFTFDARATVNAGGGVFNLDLTFSLLTQAQATPQASKVSWVAISASSRRTKLRGLINLEPCPSRNFQFISIDYMPVSNDAKGKVFYDVINHAFHASSFASADRLPLDVRESEGQNDDKYKKRGFTCTQLHSTRNHTIKWPVFYIRLENRSRRKSAGPTFKESCNLEDRESVADMVNLLSVATAEWLSKNNFRPRKRKTASKIKSSIGTHFSNAQQNSYTLRSAQKEREQEFVHHETRKSPTITDRDSLDQGEMWGSSCVPEDSDRSMLVSRTNTSSTPDTTGQTQSSGAYITPSSFQMLPFWTSPRRYCICPGSDLYAGSIQGESASGTQHGSISRSETSNTNASRQPQPTLAAQHRMAENNSQDLDKLVTWQDPATNKEYLFNTRSGVLQLQKTERMSQVSPYTLSRYWRDHSRTINIKRETGKQLSYSKVPGWFQSLNSGWISSTFHPQDISLRLLTPGDAKSACVFQPSIHLTTGSLKKYTEAVISLSLKNALVISQVDNKYILIKVKRIYANTLVIVDQHAASERIIVENLLRGLCQSQKARSSPGFSPATSDPHFSSVTDSVHLPTPINVNLESATEVELFRSHARYFARWGIVFDLGATYRERLASDNTDFLNGVMVKVVALPAVVAQRFYANETALKEFLRTALHNKPTEKPMSPSGYQLSPDARRDFTNQSWLREIGDCPAGLLEAINSQACRSAVMFNDTLTFDECQKLIAQVAGCAFPLLCAHGRPTAVTLVSWHQATKGSPDSTLSMHEFHNYEVFLEERRCNEALDQLSMVS